MPKGGVYDIFNLHKGQGAAGGRARPITFKTMGSLFFGGSVLKGADGFSGVSAVFECMGEADELPAQGQALELLSLERLAHGIAWMRYKFHTV